MFGIDTIIDAKTITEPKLKIAIVGVPKIGKSWLAATAPGPVFFADFDSRAASLKGKEGVTVKTYADRDPNMPTAMASFEADLGVFEYRKTKGESIPETYVLDSLTYMRKAAELELIKQQSNLGRPLKIGPRTFKIGSGWDIINGNRAYLEYCIGRISALGNLIVICHEQEEKDKLTSTKDEKKYTGKITIQPEYMASILSLFDDVWRLDADYSGKRFITTGLDSEFNGSNTMGLPAKVENPNIQDLLAKHRGNVVKP